MATAIVWLTNIIQNIFVLNEQTPAGLEQHEDE